MFHNNKKRIHENNGFNSKKIQKINSDELSDEQSTLDTELTNEEKLILQQDDNLNLSFSNEELKNFAEISNLDNEFCIDEFLNSQAEMTLLPVISTLPLNNADTITFSSVNHLEKISEDSDLIERLITEKLEPFKKEFPQIIPSDYMPSTKLSAAFNHIKTKNLKKSKLVSSITGIKSINCSKGLEIDTAQFQIWRGNVPYAPTLIDNPNMDFKSPIEMLLEADLQKFKAELPINLVGFIPNQKLVDTLKKIVNSHLIKQFFKKITGIDSFDETGITLADEKQFQKWRGTIPYVPTILEEEIVQLKVKMETALEKCKPYFQTDSLTKPSSILRDDLNRIKGKSPKTITLFQDITGIESVTKERGISFKNENQFWKWLGNAATVMPQEDLLSIKSKMEKELDKYKKYIPFDISLVKRSKDLITILNQIRGKTPKSRAIFSEITGIDRINVPEGMSLNNERQFQTWRGNVPYDPTMIEAEYLAIKNKMEQELEEYKTVFPANVESFIIPESLSAPLNRIKTRTPQIAAIFTEITGMIGIQKNMKLIYEPNKLNAWLGRETLQPKARSETADNFSRKEKFGQ